ncbi:MAG: ABC transporter ATP-binding protein [Eubacteriales bacterium]|nr:ABC transporter ATP-binding protein [Eubacteriales bacterium]
MSMLTVENLNVYYGVIHALKNISFHVEEKEIVALIGANGAGKTTTLQTVSGMLRAKSGSIRFADREISRMPEHLIVKQGISHVPEGRRMFANLTVLENLKMGAFTRKDKKEIDDSLSMVYERFPRLKERTRQLAGTLSGGEQQMLAMGRALMSNPRILLLDEPSMGLSPLLVSEIFDIIQAINKQGVTILLVEQNAKKALSIANRAYVLETGSIVKEDSAQALLNDDAIKKAYLGE